MSFSNIDATTRDKTGDNSCFIPSSVLSTAATNCPTTVASSFPLTDSVEKSSKTQLSQSSSYPSNSTMYPPSVSRTSMASMWGIGGFTTPQQPIYHPCPSRTIASTLGNPQMPSVYLNSRAPMGFNFR